MNILIVRVSSFGDLVHNMPMVADLRRRFPDAKIDWVAEEAYIDLVRLNDGVRDVIPVALRRWRKTAFSRETRAEFKAFREHLRSQAYDLVFDTQGLFKSGFLMRLARLAPHGRRIGMANATEGSGYEGISRIFHDTSIGFDRRTHAVARGRIVAAKAAGYELDTAPDFGMRAPEIAPAWLPEEPYAAFFHGTARAAKKWAEENWIALGAFMNVQGLPVLLGWGNEEERDTAQRLAARIERAVVLPKLPMMEAVAFAQRARIAVGVDTGLTHIAAAYCRPTIELYCDSPRWKTEGNWSENIINLGDQGRPPSADEVILASARLLAATHV